MSINIYKVEENQAIKCSNVILDSDRNYIIVDRNIQPPKIWVWRGPNAVIKDQYSAGVLAIKIKTQESLYGSRIVIVDSGAEPTDFPKLDEVESGEPILDILIENEPNSNPIFIPMDELKIRELAYDLSQQLKSYDEIVWFLAENELRLKNAFDPSSNPFEDAFPESVAVYPQKIVSQIDEDETRKLAAEIFKRGSPIQDLHWFLAERIFLVENAKKY